MRNNLVKVIITCGIEESLGLRCPPVWSPARQYGLGPACKANWSDLINRHHLELLAYILVSMPYWEWDGLSGMDEMRKYLLQTPTLHYSLPGEDPQSILYTHLQQHHRKAETGPRIL